VIVLVGDATKEGAREGFFPAVLRELEHRGISHRVVWLTSGGCHPQDLWALRQVPRDDPLVWLVADASCAALWFLVYGRGRIYCYAHHSTLSELKLEGERPPERHPLARLGPIDGVFVDSAATEHQLIEWFPNLRERTWVVGLAVDVDELQQRADQPKQPNLVLLTEPFAAETGHILKVELARRLLLEGYEVQQLIRDEREAFLTEAHVETRSLYDYASSLGVQFAFTRSLIERHRLMGRAEYLLAMARRRGPGHVNLMTIIEASILGTAVLVPDLSPLADYLPADNIYPAFNLLDLEQKLHQPAGELLSAQRQHLESLVVSYTGTAVVDRLLAVMTEDGVDIDDGAEVEDGADAEETTVAE